MSPKTKIVCTIGPAVATYDKIVALIEAGMDVARINFSHGTQEEHERTIGFLKKAREKLGRPLAIMADTQGPEIRLGKVQGDAIPIKAGQRLKFAAKGDGKQTIEIHPIEVLGSLHKGTRVLFDDGYLIAQVVEVHPQWIEIEMQNAGTLKTGKKMNVPGVHLSIPAMSQKDVSDLEFACTHDVDLVAASFIRSARHILSIKELLAQNQKPHILVIAKIESTEGIEQFDSIVQAADGIMIARGDLGVELDLALVPKLQKMMIRKCFQCSKPSITATQMLESMITNPARLVPRPQTLPTLFTMRRRASCSLGKRPSVSTRSKRCSGCGALRRWPRTILITARFSSSIRSAIITTCLLLWPWPL